MDSFYTRSYREVIPDLGNQEHWNEITLNTGGTQSTLQDIKVTEKADGFYFQETAKNENRNRFLYWRTYHDVLELSEISLDHNLIGSNVRYKFTDSPVLSVNITEQENLVIILVATVNSLHRLNFPHPDTFYKADSLETRSFSILHQAIGVSGKDPTSFYVIGQNTSSHNPIPHSATSSLAANKQDVFFAMAAYQTNLTLFTMNCQTGQTVTNVLKEHHIMPRIFSNITGALRGKSNTSDSLHATSLVFVTIGGQTFVVALYRDNYIRMWSTVSLQCVCSLNCIRDGSEGKAQGPQTNSLRKVNDTNLCAFLSHSTGSEFVSIKISGDGNTIFSMSRKKVIPAPQYDLADFQVTESKIWALWCNVQGEFTISTFNLGHGYGVNWISAAMEPPPDRYSVFVEQGTDPRQAYCSYIFHPGKFEKSVISKALMMFRRLNVTTEVNLPLSMLKDRVCQAVESEIQNEIKDFDVSDDEYIEVSTRFWERFYSCCEQYHIKACQPIGLVILEPVGGICVVKKNTFSLLRPCEALEHLMLAGENVEIDNFIATHFAGNEKNGEDLVQLVTILALLEQWITDEVKIDFDKKLYQLEMPNVVTAKLVSDILSSEHGEETLPRSFLVTIQQKMQSISDLKTAIGSLLEQLRMDHGYPEAMRTHANLGDSSRYFLSLGNIFGSSTGISIVSESVRQIALIRYALCRNLLILQQILVDTSGFSCDILETIRSHFMTETVVFIQSYYVAVWICETPLNLTNLPSLENSMQRLNLLHLTETRRPFSSQMQASTLLSVFLDSKGLNTALALYSETPLGNIQSSHWQTTLLPVVTIIGQLIWPVSGNFVFGEWLFGGCHHVIIQEYVRLLNSWCEWNSCSRQFILAVSLLDSGETHKAYDLFLQSAKGVLTDQFLNGKILRSGNDLTPNEAVAQYYLKVIQLFEQQCALDYVILLAQAAIGMLEKTSPQLPDFQSIVFNNHLILEHYEEAYHSLIYNAETSRRKDCLRQLVVCLFNKKRLDLLMHFPYVGLQDELENIIESRARSMSIENNEHYNFLYAFHITKGNMRKASSIMYEQGMRLLLECDTIESMQKRYECLLVCINSLSLVDEKYMWIAKPVINDDIGSSNSMDIDKDTGRPQVIVLEREDIKKELLLTEAMLSLTKHRKDIGCILNAEASELSMILANSGLYTPAIKLAGGFDISLEPIFDTLAVACYRASDDNSNEQWSWLQENDLADLPHKNSAADMAWNLLQNLVEKHENPNSTILRKCVVNKLLSVGAFIPQWLLTSFKIANPTELLRLYVNHGRLIEATDIAKEYINALLGSGCEYFKIKHGLIATEMALCSPISAIDMLVYGLKLNSESVEYKQSATDLEELIDKYLSTAVRTSNDKIQYEYQSALGYH